MMLVANNKAGVAISNTLLPVFLLNPESIWTFSTSNLSAEVTADPSQNNYIAPLGDSSGTAGAWEKMQIGGADPWTYITLASDFSTTSATAVDVTGMAFTPAASTTYEFEAMLLCRTASATEAARPGLAWPTGGTDGVAEVSMTNAAGTVAETRGNIAAAILGTGTTIPNTTNSHMGTVKGMFIAGATPSGTVKLQLAAETGGASVTIKAGSFLKYRTLV